MNALRHSRVSPTVLSAALVAFALLWVVGARVFYVTNLQSKDGVSAAPTWALGAVIIIPIVTAFVLIPALVRARRGNGERLRAFDYIALAIAGGPLLYIASLFLRVFQS
jgi:hypothetical protein